MSLPPYVRKGATSRAKGRFNFVIPSTVGGLTASTTQTQVGGLPLTAQVNVVATVANAGDAVTLPSLEAGQWVDVYNAGAHAMSVFPFGAADTIDGGGAAAAVTLTNPKRCRFTCVSAGVIVSAQLGAVSA